MQKTFTLICLLFNWVILSSCEKEPSEIIVIDESIERNLDSIEVKVGSEILDNFHEEAQDSDLDVKFITTSLSPNDTVVRRIYHYKNSFFSGMKLAFTQHKGFILSPDMIWLLITQGIKEHIDKNPENYESVFLTPESKRKIIIVDNNLSYDAPNEIWENLINNFTDSVYEEANSEITQSFINVFSTSSRSSLIVQKATLLSVMENWIEFGSVTLCGIPEIRITGTKNDWIEIRKDFNHLSKELGLKWWSDNVNPILNNIILSYDGKIDLEFWRSMYKYFESDVSGEVDGLNGWITNFIPYIDDKPRSNWLDTLKEDQLPPGIEEFRFTWQYLEEKRHLVLSSGFMFAEVIDGFLIEPKLNWTLIQDPGEERLKEIRDSVEAVMKKEREELFGPFQESSGLNSEIEKPLPGGIQEMIDSL